jgi:hypothetical protein
MTDSAIETFVNRLRERPWLEADRIAAIDQGLRTSVRDPDLAALTRTHLLPM